MKSQSLLTLVLCGAATTAAAQNSAWLPEAGTLQATPFFTFSTFDEFWIGSDTKMENPPNGDSLEQYTGYVALEYGILPNLAADAAVGYTAVTSGAFGDEDDTGLADTQIGLRYRLTEQGDSASWMPAIAVRAAGIIAGTYNPNLPFSPGDGADGFQASVLLGSQFDCGFGYFGDVGYRVRGSNVPDEFLASAGVLQQIGDFTVSFAYRLAQCVSGSNIGDPGFTFPGLQEINQIVEGGLAYTDRGGRQYQFLVAGNVDGKNTGDKLIFGVAVTLPFNLR